MKEAEAKTKQCPMQLTGPRHQGKCIGMECMAWRKKLTPMRGEQKSDGTSIVHEWGDLGEGYCGLGGTQ